MPYIGNTAADRFVASKAASVYSGDGSTTAFTLEHAVGSDEDILVSVDGVIQEPSVAYAVSSGTTLTFTAAPSSNSGNNIFVYYLFRTVATVDHPSTSALSATSGTFSGVVDADAGITVDNITIDGTEIDLSSGDLTLDVAGNILLDADDGNIHFKDGGTGFVSIINSSGDAVIQGGVQDKDIIFKGNDGGGVITALTLDMSAAGEATFNDNIVMGTANKGIYLGVTSATASNLLDDYEEGTFTPAPSSGSVANKTGKYLKIGNLVHVTMELSNFSGGSSSAVFQIGGIPFTNNDDESTGSNYVDNVNTGTGYGHLTTYVYPNNTIFRLFDQGDDVASYPLTYASFDSSSKVTASFTYEIA